MTATAMLLRAACLALLASCNSVSGFRGVPYKAARRRLAQSQLVRPSLQSIGCIAARPRVVLPAGISKRIRFRNTWPHACGILRGAAAAGVLTMGHLGTAQQPPGSTKL